MAFGVATVVTYLGLAIEAKRMIGATPTQAEPNEVAIGTGAHGAGRTASQTDTALSAQSGARVLGTSSTVTTAQTNDTYQTVATFTAGGTVAIDEAGTFDAASAGNMYVSATMNTISLNSGDSLQLTIKVQFQ